MSWQHALVIGKFLPPHLGHSSCIEAATAHAATVTVVVCDRRGEAPPAEQRARWIAEMHPTADVVVLDDLCAPHGTAACLPACSALWAAVVADRVGGVDVVFSSESYGPRFAAELGCAHRYVDPERRRVPVSGTAVRAELTRNWQHLHPVVRRGLTRKVVVVGAESTGTTTLSLDLAGALGAQWVREAGRDVSAELSGRFGGIELVQWHPAHFEHIAERQQALERAAIARAAETPPGEFGPLVVCDTDVAATSVWQLRYTGRLNARLEEAAAADPPLLYLLTSHDGVEFEDDGLRDGEAVRADMTGWFHKLLERLGVPFVELTGDRCARLSSALDAVASHARSMPLFHYA